MENEFGITSFDNIVFDSGDKARIEIRVTNRFPIVFHKTITKGDCNGRCHSVDEKVIFGSQNNVCFYLQIFPLNRNKLKFQLFRLKKVMQENGKSSTSSSVSSKKKKLNLNNY